MTTNSPSSIAEAFAAWREARRAYNTAAQADLERLAVTLPATTAADVMLLIRMTLEPGDANGAAAEALIARAHATAGIAA